MDPKDYEDFVCGAFGKAETGKPIARWKDPAALATSDLYAVAEKAGIELLLLKTAVLYSLAIHYRFAFKPEKARIGTIMEKVDEAINREAVLTAIREHEAGQYDQ